MNQKRVCGIVAMATLEHKASGSWLEMILSVVSIAISSMRSSSLKPASRASTKNPFEAGGRNRSAEPLTLIHSFLGGKMNARSLCGAEYFFTFIDDSTHYTWVYPLERKSDAFNQFLKWKALAENSSGRRLKVLRTDRGGEYTSTEFEEFLESAGIRHERTIPKTPQQNGVSERMNRTLVESVALDAC